MVVILHNIRSLHNVGSIFRTADAAGVDKIYLCGITPEPVDRFGKIRPQLEKVSLGAEKTVPWARCGSTDSTDSLRASSPQATLKLIDWLKKEGYKIFAIEQSKKSIPYYKTAITRDSKVALVLGNEIKGLSQSILKKCDKILEIPMRGRKESLNVAVAFGIIVFRLIHPSR